MSSMLKNGMDQACPEYAKNEAGPSTINDYFPLGFVNIIVVVEIKQRYYLFFFIDVVY